MWKAAVDMKVVCIQTKAALYWLYFEARVCIDLRYSNKNEKLLCSLLLNFIISVSANIYKIKKQLYCTKTIFIQYF